MPKVHVKDTSIKVHKINSVKDKLVTKLISIEDPNFGNNWAKNS